MSRIWGAEAVRDVAPVTVAGFRPAEGGFRSLYTAPAGQLTAAMRGAVVEVEPEIDLVEEARMEAFTLGFDEGCRVTAEANAADADAAIATSNEYACVVLTADCLPVMLCNRAGTQVAVAHAGWRGLAGGVLEATIAAMNTDPDDILVWLGPAISNAQFEVGPEVYGAFVAVHPDTADAFDHSPYRLGHYMADLYRLARFRLEALGVNNISGGHFCTACESRFYSYRRDGGKAGRMASVIWIK